MDLIGQQIDLLWFTTDADGNLQDTDATPVVTVTGATGQVTTNEGTGTYRTKVTPTTDGRLTAKFVGLVDAVPYVAVQYRTIHDGEAEAAGGPFPYGLASWESRVS